MPPPALVALEHLERRKIAPTGVEPGQALQERELFRDDEGALRRLRGAHPRELTRMHETSRDPGQSDVAPELSSSARYVAPPRSVKVCARPRTPDHASPSLTPTPSADHR